MEQRLPISLVRQGTKYSTKYVSALVKQLNIFNIKDITTLTDQGDTPSKRRKLRMGYEGWTSKMELFAPWNKDLRPCFYIDLDTIILWDISDILKNKGEDLWLIRDFYNLERSNSGLMIIPEDTEEIWKKFCSYDKDNFRDGNFLNEMPHKILQDTYTGIVSYKADECQDAPKGRICCFHGIPKQEDCGGWVKKIWI